MTKTKKKPQEAPPEVPPPRRLSRRRAFFVIAFVAIMVLALDIVSLSFVTDRLFSDDNAGISHTITEPDAPLASFYEPGVLYWRNDILRWAQQYGVNPNVIAIVIQIESCGDPTALSSAGAVGLMQIMPFHFEDGDNMLDPEMNVQRGMSVFYECLTQFANWDLGLALACYNGGPSVTQRDPATWASETQAYYHWATGLWQDVVSGADTSETLQEWLDAGGAGLCRQAAASLYPADTNSQTGGSGSH